MRKFVRNITALVIVALCHWSSAAEPVQSSADKFPLPAASAQDASLKIVNAVFKKEIAAAKSPGQKSELANKLLLAAAEEQKDPSAKYSLLSVAKSTATDAGDVQLALKIIEALSQSFQVDGLKLKLECLAATSKSTKDAADRKDRATIYAALADEALAEDRYDVAKEAANLSLINARAANDPEVIEPANVHVQHVREAEAAFLQVKQAASVLASKPSDPDANLQVGRFLCFVKGDWHGGLQHIAKGSDKALKGLADDELAEPAEVEKKALLADRWWELGDKVQGIAAEGCHRHAADIYAEVVGGMSGLAKAKAEKRVAQSKSTGSLSRTPWKFMGVKKYVEEIHVLNHALIPKELEGEFAGTTGRIWGRKKVDVASIAGRACGWIGQGLVWTVQRETGFPATFNLTCKHPNRYQIVFYDSNGIWDSTDGKYNGDLLGFADFELKAGADIKITIALDKTSGQFTVTADGKNVLDKKLLNEDRPLFVVFALVARSVGDECDTSVRLQVGAPQPSK